MEVRGSDFITDTLTSSGFIHLLATDGNMDIGTVSANKDIHLSMDNGNLVAKSIASSTGSVSMVVNGSVNATAISAEGDINGKSSADFTAGDILSRSGSVILNSNGKVIGNTVTANDTIDITAQGGTFINSMSGGRLKFALTVPGAELNVGKVDVRNSVSAIADNVIFSDLVHTGTAPLQIAISGGSKPMADQVTVNVTSPIGVQFNNLIADKVTIKGQTDTIEMYNTKIGTRAEVRNNYYTALADNNPPRTFLGSDILIRPLTSYYDLFMRGKNVSTNTMVVYSQGGIVVNGSATSENAVTIANKVINPPNRTQMGEFELSGILMRNSGVNMQHYNNPATLVDTTQIINSQTTVETSNSGVQVSEQ